MAIYPVDSDILPLNNWWQMDNHKTLKGLVSDLFEPLACEQALLFGRAKQVSRERASEGPHWLSTGAIDKSHIDHLISNWHSRNNC